MERRLSKLNALSDSRLYFEVDRVCIRDMRESSLELFYKARWTEFDWEIRKETSS